LMVAAAGGRTEALAALLEGGAFPFASASDSEEGDHLGRTALHWAAAKVSTKASRPHTGASSSQNFGARCVSNLLRIDEFLKSFLVTNTCALCARRAKRSAWGCWSRPGSTPHSQTAAAGPRCTAPSCTGRQPPAPASSPATRPTPPLRTSSAAPRRFFGGHPTHALARSLVWVGVCLFCFV